MSVILSSTPAVAAEIVVVGSPTDNASAAAMAIIASVRSSVLDHPWLGLSEIDVALRTGADPRDSLKKATRDIRAARAKYDELLIDDANKLVQSGIAGYRDNLSHIVDMRPVSRALELAGAIALSRNDAKAAAEYIQEALAVSPDAHPSGELYNPPMVKKWQSISAHYRGQPTSVLIVEAPDGEPAVVEIDGRYRGLAPFTAKDILPGNHYVRVSRAGSAPWAQRVTVGKKAVRVEPTLDTVERAAAFVAARAKAWDADPEIRKSGIESLVATLRADYVVLVSTTPRDTIGAPALTPVHAELYSAQKNRVVRSADAALGVRPGFAPPLSRTFIDALLPVAPRVVLAGTQNEIGEPDVVSASKRQVALSVKTIIQNDVREIAPLDAACTSDEACMLRTAGEAEAILTARVSQAGKDSDVALSIYVGNREVGHATIDKVRSNGDALLFAIADLMNAAFLELDDRRLANEALKIQQTADAPTQGLDLDSSAPTRRNGRKTVGLITAGAGLAVAVGGFTLAAVEASVLEDAGSTGDAKSSARSWGRVGVIAGGVGVAAVIVGTVLWLTAPETPAESTAATAE